MTLPEFSFSLTLPDVSPLLRLLDLFVDAYDVALRAIPQKYADLIYLHFIQDKSKKDLAEIFGVTERTISRRIDKALKLVVAVIREKKLPEPTGWQHILSDYLDKAGRP